MMKIFFKLTCLFLITCPLALGALPSKTKVSSNDSTAGFLNGKLVAGSNITLTEGSDGGNEILTIASTSGGSGLPASDGTSIVEGSSDGTKEIRFEVDGLTTGTIRVITPPDEDFTMVGVASTQTLTNKTLTAPTLTDASITGSLNIPNGAAPTVDAAGEIAMDTTITDHNGLLRYYDGTTEMIIIAIDTAKLTSTDNHIVKYDAGSNDFQMEVDDTTSSSADAITVNSSAAADANFLDNTYIDWALNTATTPDDITAKFNYAETLSGDPTLSSAEVIFTSNGFLAEGATADGIFLGLILPNSGNFLPLGKNC